MKFLLILIFTFFTFSSHALSIDPVTGVTDEKMCLKLNLYHESRGEPLKGILEVLKVTIARTKAKGFPKSVCDVVWQQTPVTQFEWTNDGYADFTIMDQKSWKMIDKIVDMYYNNEINLKIDRNITFYHAGTITKFFKTLKFSHKIGGHMFYKAE